MKDFEAFLEGRGRMAEVLRALPAFEPPAAMEAHFRARLPADRMLATTPGADGFFEPPATLTDAVMAEAARLDAAQAPRREAALRDPRGDDLGPSAQAWLARQQPAARPSPRPPKRRRWGWFNALGGALAATVALSVALQVLRETPIEPLSESAPSSAPTPSVPGRQSEAAAGPASAAPLPEGGSVRGLARREEAMDTGAGAAAANREADQAPLRPAPASLAAAAPPALSDAQVTGAVAMGEPQSPGPPAAASFAKREARATPKPSREPAPAQAEPGPATAPLAQAPSSAQLAQEPASAGGNAQFERRQRLLRESASSAGEREELAPRTLSLRLDEASAVIASRMLALAPGARAWRLSTHPNDQMAGRIKLDALREELERRGHSAPLGLASGHQRPGELLIEALD